MKIRDTVTGREAEVPENYRHEGEEAQRYIWTDGNFGCDCNRAMILARAMGEDVGPYDDFPCGEGRYALLDYPWEPWGGE